MPEQGSHGGPAACEPPFIAELRRLGHQVTEEIYAHSDSKAGVSSRVTRVMRTRERFQERLAADRYDLVHINTSFDPRALLRDAVVVPNIRARGVKVFVKFHGGDVELLRTKNPALKLARRRVLAHADGIGLLSSEEQLAFQQSAIPSEKLFVIKNVVEPNPSQRDPDFRRRLNLPGDAPLLLFIGRFIPAKGLLDVIRACALLRDRGINYHLLCLGDGPTRQEAENEVASLELKERVQFLGYIPEEQTKTFYTNSDVLLFPTYHYEGFPMVIFNAAAAGLHIITTCIRAAADYLREPQNCLFVTARNPEMLARRIVELLSDQQLAAAMAANNRQLAARFSAQIVTAEYLRAYEAVLGISRTKNK